MTNPTSSAVRLSWDDVWIVIPAYNEFRTIRHAAKGALQYCPRVIVVDDGSIDDTASQLDGLSVTLLKHERNLGKAASLRTAFTYALAHGARCAITLDGDGQHSPDDASTLLAVWQANPDKVVIGSRLHDRAQFPRARYYANRFACFWISWAAGHPIADSQSGFRVYPNEVMRMAVNGGARGSGFTLESEILIEASRYAIQTMAVAIPGRYPPNARQSHFRPVRDIARIVVMVAGRLLGQGMAPIGLLHSLAPATVLPGRAAQTEAGRPDCESLSASATETR